MGSEVPLSSGKKGWLYQPKLPDNWTRVPLFSIAEWANGLAFRDIQFSQTGMPVIKIAEIKNGISGQTKFTEQTFDESVHIRLGDLLFSWSGQPETSIDAYWWRGPDGWLNQHVFRVTPSKCIDRTFFYYLLRYLNPSFVGIARNKQTTGLGHVTKRDLENIEAAYPPLPEQRAIAHILGTLDDKIELNQRMNETLEGMARALFKSWFVDFDPVRRNMARKQQPSPRPPLPGGEGTSGGKALRHQLPPSPPGRRDGDEGGFGSTAFDHLFPDEFEDSELGQIPKGWKLTSFTENIDVIGGGTPKTSNPDYWDGEIPWFSVVDTPASCDVFVVRTEKTITQAGVDNSSTRILPIGTTIITARGTVGNLALVGKPMAMNQSCYGLKDNRGEYGYFLYFSTTAVVDTLRQRSHGSVFNTITRNTLDGTPVVAPPENLIKAYENVVSKMLGSILCALNQNYTLAALRDTLLPKLISGEIRVQDAQRIIEEEI